MKTKMKKMGGGVICLILMAFALGGLFLFPANAVAAQTCELSAETWNFTSGDFWESENWGTECDEIATSFVEFQGGLAPPSGQGLAQELTQVSDARTFVLNVTNFVLSFLGLTAVLIIIYGGFLFVTSRGNEEQSTNGKKTITYAVVGIVVVLISFALVNTLIRQAPVGGENGNLDPAGRSGSAPEGQQIAAARLFNLAALEIQSSLQNFLLAYQRFTRIADHLEGIKGLPVPLDGPDAKNFLRELNTGLIDIIRVVDPFSEVAVAAKKIQKEFTEVWLRATEEELEGALAFHKNEERSIGHLPFAEKALAQPRIRNTPGLEESVTSGRARLSETARSRTRPQSFYNDGTGDLHFSFTKAYDDSNIGQANENDFLKTIEDIQRRLEIVKDGLGPIGTAPAGDFINRGITSEKELQLALSEISPDMTIGEAFGQTENALEAAKGLVSTPDDVASVRDTSKKLLVLYTLVRDIKFMVVRVNANIGEGNAPLTAQFTSIGSLDPSGQTISDQQHEWDLDGNGVSNEEVNSLGCNERTGASATCVYELAGTYRAILRLNPKDGVQQVASGIGVFTLKVLPPKSRINLEAQIGDHKEVLHAFDDRGRITVNKNQFQITLKEAENGVRFDASKTTDGTGQPTGIVNYEWIFGDGTNAIVGPTASVIDNPKKKYTKTGIFPLRLQVTDKSSVQDRKYVNIAVTNIAARINAPGFRGDLNTIFEFDGSRSSSDLGRITSFEWSVLNPEGIPVENIQNNRNETFRYQFPSAGKYTLKLKVADQSGESAETEVLVFVESQAPTASFTIQGCVTPNEPCLDPTQPSLVEFNAETSFDPDAGDTLSYRWEALSPASEGVDFNVVEGALQDESAEETKRIRLKFLKTGTYKIRLTTEDQHRDPELRKSANVTKEIHVTSVVDLAWDPAMEVAKQLDEEGRATFEIKANVANAASYKIDDGKGNTDEFNLGPGETIITAEYTYEQAKVYTVKLTASDPQNGETTIEKRLYIAAPETPIAVVSLAVEEQSIFFNPDEPISPPLLRGVRISFDGSESLNASGVRSENLEYSWNFGDGDRSSQAATIHTYEDISPADPGYFEVTLTIHDTESGQNTETKVLLPVSGAKPRMNSLIVRKLSSGEETPLDFNISSEGAADPDGSIAELTFWYFDEDDPERKLGVVTTPLSSATITIETKGQQGEEKRYLFCASVKDNENNISQCDELFPNQQNLPFAVVKNGPNQAPTAAFSTDRTTIHVGESVTFASSSTDPDGQVVKYIWDVMGDGFHNDSETELSRITQTYTQRAPQGGYRVKLKIIDDKGAAGFSQEVPIFVDLPFNPPTADFTYTPAASGTEIQFHAVDAALLSRVAPGSNATLTAFEWDFDTSREFCEGGTRCGAQVCAANPKLCDRDATNDPDAKIPNPIHEYPASGQYQVRLLVEDSNGQKDDVLKIINVVRGAANPDAAPVLEAHITTTPTYRLENNRKVIHLNPPFGNYDNVEFFFGNSLGNIHEYVLDRNVFFDSGHERPGIDECIEAPEIPPGEEDLYFGDGCTDNDADIVSDEGSRTFTVRYGRPAPETEYFTAHPDGIFRARLTVYGTDENQVIITNTDEIDIVFDEPNAASQLAGFALRKFGPAGAVLIGLLSGAILAFIGYYVSLVFRRGRPRTL